MELFSCLFGGGCAILLFERIEADEKNGGIIMTNQKINEVIKAFAYGETPEQVAEVEGISAEAAKQVQREHADDIVEEKTMLQEAGYLK